MKKLTFLLSVTIVLWSCTKTDVVELQKEVIDTRSVIGESSTIPDANFEEPIVMQQSFSNQWALKNTNYPGMDINYEPISMSDYPNIRNIKVAVVDSGIITDHPNLPAPVASYDAHNLRQGNVVYGRHGTAVAGIIAASHGTSGIAGVAPGVQLISVSVKTEQEFPQNSTPLKNVAEGIKWAVNQGARIINCSWVTGTNDKDLDAAIVYAINRGCIVVCGMGNDGLDLYYGGWGGGPYRAPAMMYVDKTIGVGAIEENGSRWAHSNYGRHIIDVVAPGHTILTTLDVPSVLAYFTGTSFAAPHVSGIIALMLATDPTLAVDEVNEIIGQTAREMRGYSTTNSYNDAVGYGLVDAYAAVEMARSYSAVLTRPALRLEMHPALNPILNGSGTITVTNPVRGAIYEWTRNGMLVQSGRSVTFDFSEGNTLSTIHCRARMGSRKSELSSPVNIHDLWRIEVEK